VCTSPCAVISRAARAAPQVESMVNGKGMKIDCKGSESEAERIKLANEVSQT
jgi:hypothetical protein